MYYFGNHSYIPFPFFIQSDPAALLKRIEQLENQSRGDIKAQMSRLQTYGQRSGADFDKYTALGMVETASREAHRVNHEKTSYLEAAARTLRNHLEKPTAKFQAYFLALFSDKEYTKVLESIAKVDKLLDRRSASSRPTERSSRVVCFFCGVPGHIATNCFRRSQQRRGRGRFTPYERRRPPSQGPPNTGQNL